jgi:RES domain-containing protein
MANLTSPSAFDGKRKVIPMSTDSDEVRELFDLIEKCLLQAVGLECSAFRSAGVKFANEIDLLSGEGAAYYGGRWNPPGIKAIYASLDSATATKECYQEFEKYGFKEQQIRPRVFAGIKLKVNCLLDLTDARIRRRLGFRLDELMQEDWQAIQADSEESWTQAIGRGTFVAEFEGLIAPSASDRRGANVVIFPDNLAKGSQVEVMAKDELPPHPSGWA